MFNLDYTTIFEELGVKFDNGIYNIIPDSMSSRKKKQKGSVYSKIKSQSSDHAIIEYNGPSPRFSIWYGDYLKKHDLSTDRVSEIVLLGEPSTDYKTQLQSLFPNCKLTILDKSFEELKYDDLYLKHTLVFHQLGDLCLKNKANIGVINDKYTIKASRPNLEKLAKLIHNTRFIYNVILYFCDDDNMSAQMSEIDPLFGADSVCEKLSEQDFEKLKVFASLYLSSISWHKDVERYEFEPKFRFIDKLLPSHNNFYFNKPLQGTTFIEGLSHDDFEYDYLSPTHFYTNQLKNGSLTELSEYGVANDFNIWKLTIWNENNDPRCEKIISIYKEAALNGIYNAYNNLGIFYSRIGENEIAVDYFKKGIEKGDESSLVNYISLVKTNNLDANIDLLLKQLESGNGELSIWIKAINSWNNENYFNSVYLLEKLSKKKESDFTIANLEVKQAALNNLIKAYYDGNDNYDGQTNFLKIQKILKDIDFTTNKELLAVCLVKEILYSSNKDEDKKDAFDIFNTLYEKNKADELNVFNLACCYFCGIGCEVNKDLAKELCENFLENEESDLIHQLLARFFFKEGEYEKSVLEWEKVKKPSFSEKTNLAMSVYTYDKEKGFELFKQLENELACEHCHEADDYNEILRVCPKVLNRIGQYYKANNDYKYEQYLSNAANQGYASSLYSLGFIFYKNNEIDKSEYYFRRIVEQGYNVALKPLQGFLVIKKQWIEFLRIALLREKYGTGDSMNQYKIYLIIKSRLISCYKGDDIFWLKKSADSGFDLAISDYVDYLISVENDEEALSYINKYDGENEEILKKFANLKEEIKERLNDYVPDNYYDDYYDDYDYERDTWDALTDGMYGDYPGSGVDYDVFGF